MFSTPRSVIPLPESLRQQLLSYRRRLWTVKMLEAGAEAGAGVLLGFLALYTLERFFEASVPLRLLIFCLALLACMVIPKTLYVWGWRRRRLEQLAEILQRERPALGDRIRGAIELAENPVEQARSPALVEAALRQVPEAVGQEWHPVANIGEALADVTSGFSDAAMIAVENSIDGGVTVAQDALATIPNLRIIGEYLVPVRFVLVAPPGTRSAWP